MIVGGDGRGLMVVLVVVEGRCRESEVVVEVKAVMGWQCVVQCSGWWLWRGELEDEVVEEVNGVMEGAVV